MPRPTRRNHAVLASALGLTCILPIGCGDQKTPSPTSPPPPTAVANAELADANSLRNAAGIAPLGMSSILSLAATRHAGYQAIRFAGAIALTHYESVNGAPASSGASPDSGNALFTAIDFGDRIRAANGGTDLYPAPSGHVYYEGITTVASPGAVLSLWNTVYHRLPLCRNESIIFGFGDADGARSSFPAAHVPNVSGYSTTEYAGPGSTAVTASYWPNQGATSVDTEFDTDTESPDPLNAGNTNQTQWPGTPSVNQVGPPIHAFWPTSSDWKTVSVSFAHAGSPMPVYVLAGYFKPFPNSPQDHTANPFPSTVASGITTYDQDLNSGELFILPQFPLSSATAYTFQITAVTQANETFLTPTVTFTTR